MVSVFNYGDQDMKRSWHLAMRELTGCIESI